MINSGIYKITNIINDKIYIGSAINFKQRWYQHKYYLKLNKHQNKYLQNAWNKYGNDSFIFEIVEYCEKEKLIEQEQKWMDLTKCFNLEIGYNLVSFAGNQLGFKHSNESKLKMSIALKGRKLSEETKLKMKGRNHTKETKEKIRLSLKDRKRSEETRRKISENKKGKMQSKNHIEKLSKIRKGKNKKLDIWPHELGSKCKCLDCKNTRNIRYSRKYRTTLK